MRKLALALACASILGTSNAQAMGLGEVMVRSYLNQPLLAEIPLVDVSPQELEGLRVRLGSAQAFERQGLSLGAVAGRIQVQLQGGRQPRVVLTSKAAIHDPVLGIVVEVEGPDGVIQRGYDILLDPVSYRAPLPSVSAPVVVAEAPVPAGIALQGQVENGHYRVREGETLWRVAYNLRPPGVSVEQMMAALRAANPRAFAGPGRNGALLSGAILRIPETEEILRARVRKQEASVAQKASAEATLPATRGAEKRGSEAKVTIVPPVQSAAPVVAAPVVGEVVSPPLTGAELKGSADTVHMQEQLEAAKAEKEQLLQRLQSAEGQMAKMEELLRLKDEQIKQLEQLLQAAPGGGEKPSAAVESTPSPSAVADKVADKPLETPLSPARSAQPAPVVMPEEEEGLLSLLTQPIVLGGGGVAALLLALLLGRLRRRREETLVPPAPVSLSEAPAPAPVSAVEAAVPLGAAAGAALGGAAEAWGGTEEDAPRSAIESVQSILEEVDVMQAYGLHDRAREVLEEAIARMPGSDVLQARRVRLLHEMGAREEFLRAAEAYRAAHPAADDPHWAAIQAIGEAAYADTPLFGGATGVRPEVSDELGHAPEASGELGHAPEAETALEFHAPFIMPEASTEAIPEPGLQAEAPAFEGARAPEAVEPLKVEAAAEERSVHAEAELEPLTLEWPGLELEGSERTAVVPPPAVEPESLPALDLEPLSLEPVVAESPSAVVESGEVPPPIEALEIPPLPTPDSLPAMAEADISEDDLMLLGLDATSIADQPLELTGLLDEGGEGQQTSFPPSLKVPAPAVAELASAPAESVAPAVASAEDEPPMPSARAKEEVDERAIKLDMAQALLELDDPKGARQLLEEVMASRDDALSERARALLDQIAA